jgi:hypothetical protein
MRVDMSQVLNNFAAADLRVREFMSGKVFNPAADKFMPIPQAQLDLQPDVLVQRPEYR